MTRGSAKARYFMATLATAAIGIVWITVVDPPPAPRPFRAGSPPTRAATPARLVAAATAREVLGRADVLELTPDQRARLASLAAAWERDIAPLDRALDAATEEFARFAREAQQAGRARLDDVRAHSEDVQSLSALVRERRARHADEALGVLTASQRGQISDLRQMTGGTR